MASPVVLPGVTQVACPVCRARPGRPCTTRRGWIADQGSHRQRRALWLAEERAEARGRSEAPTVG